MFKKNNPGCSNAICECGTCAGVPCSTGGGGASPINPTQIVFTLSLPSSPVVYAPTISPGGRKFWLKVTDFSAWVGNYVITRNPANGCISQDLGPFGPFSMADAELYEQNAIDVLTSCPAGDDYITDMSLQYYVEYSFASDTGADTSSVVITFSYETTANHTMPGGLEVGFNNGFLRYSANPKIPCVGQSLAVTVGGELLNSSGFPCSGYTPTYPILTLSYA